MKVEIAIALFNSHGGIEEGDVVVCRKPLGGIGLKESKQFLWLKADISEELANELAEPQRDEEREIIKKRRYRIPLNKIVENIDAQFDKLKARDMDYEYQPFLPVDKDMIFTSLEPIEFQLEKLEVVLDKATETYIKEDIKAVI